MRITYTALAVAFIVMTAFYKSNWNAIIDFDLTAICFAVLAMAWKDK